MDLDRVRGCLLGGAVGDALGVPLKEITVARRLRFKYGQEAPKNLSYASRPPAPFSDETQLTLFVADGLMRHLIHGGDRGDAVRDALLVWRRAQGGPGFLRADDGWLPAVQRLYHRRLPERVLISALDAVAKGTRPGVREPINDSDGPSALTRSAAYAIALPTQEDTFDAAYRDAAWTHGDPRAALAAAAFATLLHGALRGTSLASALHSTLTTLAVVEGADGPIAQQITAAHTLAAAGPPTAEALGTLGDGKDAGSALAIALCCVMTLEAPNYYGVVRALWRAVAHEGSSDTTGALAGQLLGALLSADALPPPWLIELDMVEVIERMARDLHAAATGLPVNPSGYPRR